MTNGGLIIVIAILIAAAVGLGAWFFLSSRKSKAKTSPAGQTRADVQGLAQAETEHIFDEAFREELRNRGRLHFEKVLGENAMFLQQDLRQTTTQLNEYMRSEITRTLQEEFKKYEQSISDAKQLALGSIEKTITTIEQQRQFLETQMQTQAETQKAHIVEQFEKNMAAVINHYVLKAIGDQIDLSDQLEYILAELERNKAEIEEDIKRGA